MTVHMIRVYAAAESPDTGGMTESDINAALDDWVSKHTEWLKDVDHHHTTERAIFSDGYGTRHYGGVYRFDMADAKDTLLQKCADKLKQKVDWVRLIYHECDHNESDRMGCSWDERWDYTSKNTSAIPADIPAPASHTVTEVHR